MTDQAPKARTERTNTAQWNELAQPRRQLGFFSGARGSAKRRAGYSIEARCTKRGKGFLAQARKLSSQPIVEEDECGS